MMTPTDQDNLLRNRLLLVRQTKVTEDLLSCLLEDYTLTVEMKQEIEAERTESKRVGVLLDTLMRRGNRAFDRFIYALVQTDQDSLALSLDKDRAHPYIETRNKARQLNSNPQLNAIGYSQNSHWQGPFQYMMAQIMMSGAGHGVSSSIAGALVSHPTDELPNNSAVDANYEDIRVALNEINGPNARSIMNIQVLPGTNFHLANNHQQVYPISHLIRGRALIINNQKFRLSNMFRDGAEYDRENLKELFQQLSFEVIVRENLTAQQMKELVKEESLNPAHHNADMFILFVLSHGCHGNIYGTDVENVSIDKDITSCFSPENCPALMGKPKIFFIQACQGELRGRVYSPDSAEGDAISEIDPKLIEKMKELQLGDKEGYVPEYFNRQDVVMSYATVRGYRAWRRTDLGSWFVRCLVYVFSRRSHSEHLLDMLTEVNALLTQLKTSGVEGRYGQLAEKSDTLTKKLYFFPGAAVSSFK